MASTSCSLQVVVLLADAVCVCVCVLQATRQFLEEITKWTSQHGVSPLSKELAVKFLMARKFDVIRAIELFHSYRVSRGKLTCCG